MISEPNFVLGIKQKSLASKEDSHVHITIRSHTCLSAGSRLHGISQPPWLCAMSKSNNQVICASPYQICAHQAFACRNQPYRHTPRPPARKTQKSDQPKPSHVPPHAGSQLRNISHSPHQNPHQQIFFSDMRRFVGLLVHWSTEPEILASI